MKKKQAAGPKGGKSDRKGAPRKGGGPDRPPRRPKPSAPAKGGKPPRREAAARPRPAGSGAPAERRPTPERRGPARPGGPHRRPPPFATRAPRSAVAPGADPLLRRLGDLVAAESEVRRIHGNLCRAPRAEMVRALRAAVRHAGQPPFEPADLWLFCAARLAGEFDDPEALDALVDLLGCESDEARVEAGEQLLGLAEARLDAVASAAKRALERLPVDHPALRELPYVLGEAMHPRVVEILAPWLRHPNADVVASAIEALASLGEPAACPLLEPLCGDERLSTVDQGDDERLEATVGELASQAIELLVSIATAEGEPPGEGTSLP